MPHVLRATPEVVAHSGTGHPLAIPTNIGGGRIPCVADAPNTVRCRCWCQQVPEAAGNAVSLGGLKVTTEHRGRR